MKRYIRAVFSLSATLFTTAMIASAQCTVVVAVGGNDSNPGTVAAPLATPAMALQNVTSGGVVCLRAGTYTLTADLVASTPMTIQSYPGEMAVLTADNSAASPVGNIIVVGASNVTVQDLELSGASYYGIHVSDYVLGVPPVNTIIQRLKINQSGFIGIKVDQADNVQILNSEIYSTGSQMTGGGGIDILASLPGVANPNGPGATVFGNYVHDLTGGGIVVKGGTVGAIIDSNRVENISSGGGIYVGGDTGAEYFRNADTSECFNCIARNNIIATTDYVGLACWAAQGAQIDNNTVIDPALVLQAAFFAPPDSLGNPCTSTTVENNVFVTSGTSRMLHLVSPGPGMVIDYNHYYNALGNYAMWWESPSLTGYWSSLAAWQAGTGEDAHSVANEDPMLDTSYKQLPGSPLIDSGVTLAIVPVDINGVHRPQGAAYDKGAYEAVVAAPVPALLSAISGAGQSATAGSAFVNPLVVKVTDSAGNGVAGAVVNFKAPASGASAAFAWSATLAVMTDATGTAKTSSITSNKIAGSYAIEASTGTLAPVFFPLMNTAPPVTVQPVAVMISGGVVSAKSAFFAINGTVISDGKAVSTGLLSFFVNGAASGTAQIMKGRVKWNLPIPSGTPPGTEFSVYAVFSATPQYSAAQSATVIVRVQR